MPPVRRPAAERSICDICAEKTNRASRARDARLRAAGVPRRDPVKAREYERERSRREADTRREAGLCTRCGKRPAAEGRSSCEPCLEKKRAADRAKYAVGKAAGLKYGNPDKGLMPSEVREPADCQEFLADSLGINPRRHLPPRMVRRLSLASGKAPGRIEGGALSARISSFSTGLARR